MIGQMGEGCPLTSGITISNVMCYATSGECLEYGSTFQKIINWSLGVGHCKSVKSNKVSLSSPCTIEQVDDRSLSSLRST